uniref:Uncharacterized protein n=1 Tax=Bos indicus x Bos taurus TaxID=30522 RepID=A0A4W2DM27_BOBOX
MDWEQQTGTQQLDWEQPHEPQPPLEPPQEPQPPLEPPQEPQPPLEPPQEPRSPHMSHSPPWSPHTSRSPLCHSWSRSRLAHSSIRACSSRRAHSSWSHSPHSWSRSPHSWSHSLRNSQSSPWFWWVEGGVGQRSRWRERRCSVWGLLGRSLYIPAGAGVTWARAPFLVPVWAAFVSSLPLCSH